MDVEEVRLYRGYVIEGFLGAHVSITFDSVLFGDNYGIYYNNLLT